MSTEDEARRGPQYRSWNVTWRGLAIEARLCRRWLNSDYDHLELRCREPLPVTQTGYRSRFMPTDGSPEDDEVEAFVLAWLDDAADSKAWRDYEDSSQQGSLF